MLWSVLQVPDEDYEDFGDAEWSGYCDARHSLESGIIKAAARGGRATANHLKKSRCRLVSLGRSATRLRLARQRQSDTGEVDDRSTRRRARVNRSGLATTSMVTRSRAP